MNYCLQVNTGNAKVKNYSVSDIISKIDYLKNRVTISKVIFGWNNNKDENNILVNYLHENNIEAYLWIGVFADRDDYISLDKCEYPSVFKSTSFNKSKEDNFEFVCPSSDKNIDNFITLANDLLDGVPFDGLFLDRIRFASPSINKNAIFGCQCDRCKKYYQDKGINLNLINKHIYKKLKPLSRYNFKVTYKDCNLNKFLDAKEDLITKQITRICSYYKSKGYKIGFDIFAPELTQLVGQNVIDLQCNADFLKPMYYYQTDAPAGIPFELNGLPKKLSKFISGSNNITDATYINIFKKMSFGIDCVNIEGSDAINKDYVVKVIEDVKQSNLFNEIVLCWDLMKIDEDILNSLI